MRQPKRYWGLPYFSDNRSYQTEKTFFGGRFEGLSMEIGLIKGCGRRYKVRLRPSGPIVVCRLIDRFKTSTALLATICDCSFFRDDVDSGSTRIYGKSVPLLYLVTIRDTLRHDQELRAQRPSDIF